LLGVTPGQARRPKEVSQLIAPGLRAGRSIDRLGIKIASQIGDIIDPTSSVEVQATVFALVLAAANAARILAAAGHVRASESQLRSMIEGFALIQFVHGDDATADQWRMASSVAERRRFAYSKMKVRSAAARDFAEIWDGLSEYVHTNRNALPSHSRRRAVFGYDIPVGPLFDPLPLVLNLGLINSMEFLILEWAIENVVPATPKALTRQLRNVGGRTTRSGDGMIQVARAMKVSVEDGISLSDQRRAVAHIGSRARRAGRSDIARWVVARAKVPK
jgi:hypothetical protein